MLNTKYLTLRRPCSLLRAENSSNLRPSSFVNQRVRQKRIAVSTSDPLRALAPGTRNLKFEGIAKNSTATSGGAAVFMTALRWAFDTCSVSMVDRRAAWTMKVNMVQCRKSPWHRKEKKDHPPLSRLLYNRCRHFQDIGLSCTAARAFASANSSQRLRCL